MTDGSGRDRPPRGTPHHLLVGACAERLACEFLIGQGLRLRTRNYRTRRGEIDLVMDDADVLVFVEVRYRAPGAPVSAMESITGAKRRRLVAAAEHYVLAEKGAKSLRCRFDVVVVSGGIRWLKSAFDA